MYPLGWYGFNGAAATDIPTLGSVLLMNSLLILILGRLSPLPYLKKALGYRRRYL